jgi:hypothetical protein
VECLALSSFSSLRWTPGAVALLAGVVCVVLAAVQLVSTDMYVELGVTLGCAVVGRCSLSSGRPRVDPCLVSALEAKM